MRRTGSELPLTLNRTETAPEGLTRQLYAQLRAAILDGRLQAGDRLPPSRALAESLGVARLTVATAYEWLTAEGYVYGRVGAGTFVASAFGQRQAAADSDESVTGKRPSAEDADQSLPLEVDGAAGSRHPHLSVWARRIAEIPMLGGDTQPEHIAHDFRPSSGAAEAFPWARWRRILAAEDPFEPLAELRARERAAGAGQWDLLLGPIETRRAIAAWLRRSRAVRCEPEQVLIAGSVQQMLALLARLLIEPGQTLLVEDPCYSGFHAAFLAEGATLRGVPVDANGIAVDALPEPTKAARADAARALIVTPSHQYPTGVTLSLERRLALLEWARSAGVVLIEDDYDGDLRLEGQPLEALRGLDDRDDVIYLGTFAKALYPALHMGYAVLPHWLVEPVARARATSDRHPRWHDALAVARFIEEGDLERHLARVRRLYRARRDVLVELLRTEFGELVRVGPAEAGIHLLATLPSHVDDVALVEHAARSGIALTPLSPYVVRQRQSGLLLGFGAQTPEQMRAGVKLLAPLVRQAPHAGH